MKFLFYIILFIGYAKIALAQQCSLTLSGHIVDEDTKQMLDGAVVSIVEINQYIFTDDKGDFKFTALCSGVYTLQIIHFACDTVYKKIELLKDVHTEIYLPHTSKVLGSVIIEAQKEIGNTGIKKELSDKHKEESKGLSLAETLSKLNGVTMLQTGSTISKPVIHGLHSNRILTINNGVRQEGQQWGNEHAPEIDPFIADKLMVIKGVDELRYGSDAIGGVVLVQPKPLKNTEGYSGEINSAYFTNNKQYVLSGMWEHQPKKVPAFSYRLQGTLKKGANATTPDYRLNNTGSEERNFSVTAGYNKNNNFNTQLYYSLFDTKLGIFTGSHIGNITDLENAIAANKPNDVFLGENTYRIDRPYQDVTHHLLKSQTFLKKGEHKFNLILAGQLNNRMEYDIVRNSSNTKPQLNLSVNTYTQELNWEHPKKYGFNGVAGIALMQQENRYSGRYFIPNFNANTYGGYFIEKWHRHKWELQAGLRYDYKTINTLRLKFNGDTINHNFRFSTLASSFNAIYRPSTNWHLNTNLSFASRAPYVNELLSDGIHHGTATYERGNIYLKTEQSANLNTGINYTNDKDNFRVDVLMYVNSIRNFIYRQPIPNSPVLTIAGAFPLIEYRQTDALLYGFDLGVSWSIITPLEWSAKLSVLNARDTKLNDWLILMPANRISNELTYKFNDSKHLLQSYISLEMQNVMQQKHIPDESNGVQDYKAPPEAYTLFHFNAATIVPIGNTKITIGLSVRNLFNTRYRDYLNSMRYFIDETGRNVALRVKIPFHNS